VNWRKGGGKRRPPSKVAVLIRIKRIKWELGLKESRGQIGQKEKGQRRGGRQELVKDPTQGGVGGGGGGGGGGKRGGTCERRTEIAYGIGSRTAEP